MTHGKLCTVCHVEKPLEDFHRRGHHVRSGRRATCKACTNARARQENRTRTDPHKQRVRMATRALIDAGTLVPEPCRVCGVVDVESHHPHYDQEDSHLVVTWLCKAHHALEHGSAAWTNQLDMFPVDMSA